MIQGTPWYDILANPLYVDAFAFVGAHVRDRDALIVDGDDDDENNSNQSDFVVICLNLSCIPD